MARRAKTMLQAIEDAENARRVAEEERRKQEALLCAAIESLTRHHGSRSRRGGACAHQCGLGRAGGHGCGGRAAIRRRSRRCARADDAAPKRDRSRASSWHVDATKRWRAARRSAGASKRSKATTSSSNWSPIEEEWAQLPPLVGYEMEADQLAARFAEAASACRKRARARHRAPGGPRLARRPRRRGGSPVRSGRQSRRRPLAGRVARSPRAGGHARTLRRGRPPTWWIAWPSSRRHSRRVRRRHAKRPRRRNWISCRSSRGWRHAPSARPNRKPSRLREGERLLRDITTAFEDVGTRRDDEGDRVKPLRPCARCRSRWRVA